MLELLLFLADYYFVFLGLLVLCAAGLWLNVLIEGARWSHRCARRSRTVKRLERRCAHLERQVRSMRSQRDHWMGRSAYWQRAYWRSVRHEGDDPHPTLEAPAVKEEDAPVA